MRAALRVAAVHVVLAGLALGAVAVWGTGTDPARADLVVTVPDPDPRLPVNPELVTLVRPPGLVVMDTTGERHGAWLTAVLPEQEARHLGDAGVVWAKALVSRDGEFSQGVWQFPVRDGADPAAALRAADDLYAAGGWAQRPAPAGVLVRAHEPAPEEPLAAIRAHYLRGPYLVRVEAYGPDLDRVTREFETLLDRQLTRWSPG